MTKSILPQPENNTIIGEPIKNQIDFPPKITLPNTKKGFNELYELVMALSNIHVISYLWSLSPEKETREILRLTWMEFQFLFQS